MKTGPYTSFEEHYIKANYSHMSSSKIAKQLNRSLSSVYNKAHSMGLKKTEEYLSTPEGGRIQKGDQLGVKTQYKSGQKPFNKGLKQIDFMTPEAIQKSKSTRFKKGHVPHNAKYDGAESVRDGYIYLRMSKGEWILKHRKVWMDANGPIPEGGNIIFMDGNSMNCDINNLQLVMNDELMEMNTIKRYPEDVKKAIKLVSKLNRKIEKHGK